MRFPFVCCVVLAVLGIPGPCCAHLPKVPGCGGYVVPGAHVDEPLLGQHVLTALVLFLQVHCILCGESEGWGHWDRAAGAGAAPVPEAAQEFPPSLTRADGKALVGLCFLFFCSLLTSLSLSFPLFHTGEFSPGVGTSVAEKQMVGTGSAGGHQGLCRGHCWKQHPLLERLSGTKPVRPQHQHSAQPWVSKASSQPLSPEPAQSIGIQEIGPSAKVSMGQCRAAPGQGKDVSK